MTELEKMMADGYSEDDALEVMQIRRESAERQVLLAEIKRLQPMTNRKDRNFEEGDYLPYIRDEVKMLRFLLDEAGIAY